MVKIAITGTPGIGKSCFLLYFILRLLYESTDDEPNIVKFHPEPNVCYCYYGTELAHTGSYNDFTNFLDIPNVWYLSDNEDGPPERVLAKTIVALSPRKGINACPRFHKFFKDVNRSGKLCMPLWSFEEISDCREGIFSDLSEDVVSELFDKAGGVPRSILLKPSREKEPKTAVEAGLEDIEDGLEDIEDALRHVRDLAKIHLCFMEEKETIQFSSQLIHLVPGSRDYLFANSRRQWASRYVLAKFSKSLGNQSIGYLKSSIASRHTLNP